MLYGPGLCSRNNPRSSASLRGFALRIVVSVSGIAYPGGRTRRGSAYAKFYPQEWAHGK